MTLAPSGGIVNVRIVSSELRVTELERKLLACIRQFDFGPKDVDRRIVTWPVDFLPSQGIHFQRMSLRFEFIPICHPTGALAMKMKHGLLAAGLAAMSVCAVAAESVYLSAPRMPALQRVSAANNEREYRLDAARHLYDAYSPRVFKGRLPPLIHAVLVLDMTVDANGMTKAVRRVRGPSHAPDVTAAVIEMISRASPLPVPAKLGDEVKFTEIWLVHKDGRFQLDALTAGQI